MLNTLMLALIVAMGMGLQKAALPDTPQAKHVQTYIDAFNTGDEKKFLATQEKLISPEILNRRTSAERSDIFKRMHGDFGTFKIARVIKASAQQIQLAVPNQEGIEATFTFDFEDKAPHLIKGIRIDLERGER